MTKYKIFDPDGKEKGHAIINYSTGQKSKTNLRLFMTLDYNHSFRKIRKALEDAGFVVSQSK